MVDSAHSHLVSYNTYYPLCDCFNCHSVEWTVCLFCALNNDYIEQSRLFSIRALITMIYTLSKVGCLA